VIPNHDHREVSSGSVVESATFGISRINEIHIMRILRNTMYSDKVLAVLREYSANAWDAHRSVGKGDLPIHVTLPVHGEPTLTIRDFGPGLTHHDVFKVYTQYGDSTKRGNDNTVGMLGIGSKSAFAYSDSFTVTTWQAETHADDFVGPRCGMKRVYIAVLDEEGGGVINLAHVEACDPAEVGVEIQIAVRPEDISEFHTKARRLFKHFTPRPLINCELPALPDKRTVLVNGTISPVDHYGTNEWIAVMGCVPYRIDLEQLPREQIGEFLPNISGTLFFNIGDVEISASREGLEYSKRTKAALVTKLNGLVDEYVTHALNTLDAGTFNGWEKRLRVLVLSALKLPIPEQWKALAEPHVKVVLDGAGFTLISNTSAVTRVTVTEKTRVLIDDTNKPLVGYHLSVDDYVVRFVDKIVDRAEVDAVLEAAGLTGVPIENLSALAWTPPYVKPKRVSDPKHKVRTFVFQPNGSHHYKAPFSNHWEIELRESSSLDVYVVIEGFRASEYRAFFDDYRADANLAKAFGVTMPTVYGYKHSEKKPVDRSKIEGTFYEDWRKEFIQKLLTPENLERIATLSWVDVVGDRYGGMDKKVIAQLAKVFGPTHAITELITKKVAARDPDMGAVRELARRAGLKQDQSEAHKHREAIYERYPLLRDNLTNLWRMYSWKDDDETLAVKNWRAYVLTIDELYELREAAAKPGAVIQLKSVP
jgi:hypothetical protein